MLTSDGIRAIIFGVKIWDRTEMICVHETSVVRQTSSRICIFFFFCWRSLKRGAGARDCHVSWLRRTDVSAWKPIQDGLQRQFFVVSYVPIFAWSTITVKDMALVAVLLGAISSRPVNKWLHELGLKAATPLRAIRTRNHLFMAGKGQHRPVFYGSLQTSLLSLYLRLRLQKGLRRQLSTCSHHG